jgi:hypothetical protein
MVLARCLLVPEIIYRGATDVSLHQYKLKKSHKYEEYWCFLIL